MDENLMNPAPDDIAGTGTAVSADALLSNNGFKYLKQTRPWVRLISVMFFICAVFIALGGLMLLLMRLTGDIFGNIFGNNDAAFDIFPGGSFFLGLAYLVLAAVYITPGIYLSRYAAAIKNLEAAGTSQALESALKYQKSFWRYIGVITVIGMVVTAAVIAFSLAVAVFMFLNR